MGLVEYSDSESDSEAPPPKAAARVSVAPTAVGSKKPFQKLVDRAQPGKILVNLPTPEASAAPELPEEPPAKRAKTAGGGRFSGFSSFLPPPKTTGKPAPSGGSSASKPIPRPGFHLKTGAEPAFSREAASEQDGEDGGAAAGTSGSRFGLSLPPPKATTGPTIPEGLKPEEEVKLVGKPLMFKPLSVSRKPTKKKGAAAAKAAAAAPAGSAPTPSGKEGKDVEPPPRKKISLFSVPDDTANADTAASADDRYGAGYGDEGGEDGTTGAADDLNAFAAYDAAYGGAAIDPAPDTVAPYAQQQQQQHGGELDTIADDLNLSAAARRELFGRGGVGPAAGAKVVNFDMEREYSHNEGVRAAGEQQAAFNPIRSIAPGKHNLRQLVNSVQNNQSALEDSFAAGRNNRRGAGSRYGW